MGLSGAPTRAAEARVPRRSAGASRAALAAGLLSAVLGGALLGLADSHHAVAADRLPEGGRAAPALPAETAAPTPAPPPAVDPTATGVPEPTPTAPTAPPTSPAPTEAPAPIPSDTGDAIPSPSTEPSANPTAPVESSPAVVAERPATPPAVQDSGISLISLLLAVAALLAAGAALWWWRPGPRVRGTALAAPLEPVAEPAPAVGPAGGPAPAGFTPMLIALGEAMVDSGFAVAAAQTNLHQIARAHGVTNAEIVVLPTALFITVPGAEPVETAVAAAGVAPLRLDQIDAVSRLTAEAAQSGTDPHRLTAEVKRIRAAPPPFGPLARTVGYAALCAGLALVLRGSALDIAVAAALGTAVGALQLYAPRLTTASRAVLPVLSAFGVSTAVFLLAGTDLNLGILAPLVAPLVTFLPGALLTTAAIELSTGQMLSGAGRLATGAMQLVLLALGIVAGAQLVGVPATEVTASAATPLGDVAPWVGVAVFGIGVVVHNCARLSSLGWILLVLYVAYGGQVIGGLLLGGTLSAFVGALAMAPVAAYVATQRGGPPTQVSFLPAFWLLVPGALGLIGVTQLIGADGGEALASLTTTVATMVAIAMGVLIGLAVGDSVSGGAEASRVESDDGLPA